MKSIRILALLAFATATASAQIVVIQGTDLITNSRTTLNNNFSFLNTLLGGGFSQFSGPTATRVYTLPDAAATIITSGNLGTGFGMSGSNIILNPAYYPAVSDIQNGFITDGLDSQGTTSYVASPANGCANFTLQDGVVATFRPSSSSTTTAGLAWCGSANHSIKDYTGLVDPGTSIKIGALTTVQYNSSQSVWRLPYIPASSSSGAVKLASYEVGAEDGAAILTADLTSHAFEITDVTARTLSEASCISDTGSQSVTVKIGGTTLFSITCVVPGSYSTGTVTGSTGYINAANMGSTAAAAHAMLDLSGTANGTTHDIKLHIYGN